MREYNQYGNKRFFIGIDIALVAMVVYSFDAEYYDIKEVGCYDEATCKALEKHDSKNVHVYMYKTKDINNTCEAINNEGKFVFVRAFEK